jgi:hypothetical protein
MLGFFLQARQYVNCCLECVLHELILAAHETINDTAADC